VTVTTRNPAATELNAVTGTYDLDPAHTRIGFATKHAMVTTVRGQFTGYSGTAFLDGANPAASTAELTIDPQSINTGVPQRDEHLRSGDFFDVEKHGEITFRSTAVEQLDEETFRMTGDLTILGTTKPISVDFVYTGTATDAFGNVRAGFEGATTLSRKEWGLTWNVALEAGGFLVGDKIKLEFDVSAIKRAA
jgi:polyisoprenoid-binding protein YceI